MSLDTCDDVQPNQPDNNHQPMGLCPLCDRYIPMVAAVDSTTGLSQLDSEGRLVWTIPEHVVPEPPPAPHEPTSPLRGAPWYYPPNLPTDTVPDDAELVAAGSVPVAH